MKKVLINFICILLVFCCFGTTIYASDETISPRANNVANTVTDFFIDSNSFANVVLKYVGIEGVTTGAQISTKIQKRFLLVFWSDVDGAYWVDNATGVYYSSSHSISVKSGYYRAHVEYVIYGSGGEADVINHEIEAEK